MRAAVSLRAVRIRIGVASMPGSARMSRTSSSPLISGIMKSHTMRSGWRERASSRPSPRGARRGPGRPAPTRRRRTGSCPGCPPPPGPGEPGGRAAPVGTPRVACGGIVPVERPVGCGRRQRVPGVHVVPSGATMGSSTKKSAPPSGALATPMLPPCSRTSSRAIWRPRPVPLILRVDLPSSWWKRSKTSSRWSERSRARCRRPPPGWHRPSPSQLDAAPSRPSA